MPFVPQSVELISRFRRAFGVRGSLSISVDEVAVPTVAVFNASGPPFRRTGLRWSVSRILAPAAGQVGMVNVGPIDGSSLVVDKLIVSNTSAAGVGFIWFTQPSPPTGAIPDAFCPEFDVTTTTRGVVGVASFATTPAPSGVAPSESWALPAGGFADLVREIVILPGCSLTVASDTVAQPFRLSISGLWFPSNP